jgi:hypothetical protein
VEDGAEVDPRGQAHRLRVRPDRAAACDRAARRARRALGRPGLRRSKTLRPARGNRAGLRHPLSRLHSRRGRTRRTAARVRSGGVGTGEEDHERAGDRRADGRAGRGRRARRGEEGALVPGDLARRARGAGRASRFTAKGSRLGKRFATKRTSTSAWARRRRTAKTACAATASGS